jgi:hypothetical protein
LASGSPKLAGVNDVTKIFVNVNNLVDAYALGGTQGGGNNSIYDTVFENSGMNADDAGGGPSWGLNHWQVNTLVLNDSFPRLGTDPYNSTLSGLTSLNGFFVVNRIPDFQITSYSVASNIETVTYADATNTVQPVGTNVSILGTNTSSVDVTNNTAWSGQVLASPAANCNGSGVCQLSITNPYNPTGTGYAGATGVLQIITKTNPATYGAEGCSLSGAISTGMPAGGFVWPAYNGGSWSAGSQTPPSVNDITPWYPLLTGTGSGSC